MKIAIITNYGKPYAKACTKEIVSILKQSGCAVLEQEYLFHRPSPEKDKNLESCDIVIAVGGDGTIIHTAKKAAQFGKPILGVNAGKLGFTANVEYKDLSLIKNLITGEYDIEDRFILQAEIKRDNGMKRYAALNDAVLSGKFSKIINYNLSVQDKTPYHYRADGFIIATPTGSTAYSLSAGGPVIEPTMNCMTYTPICPHSLFNRSVIFSENTVLTVTFEEQQNELYLMVDGEEAIGIHKKDTLFFSKADFTAPFIHLNERNFYDTLYQKIIGETNQ